VQKFALWQRGDTFIVGVSGGADSLCLLDVLFLLSRKYAFTLHIAHVNYHLRGRASDLDEALVKKAAEKYRLPCTVLSRKQQMKDASEEKLRDIRYAFFEKLREKTDAKHIAVAHNRDDQAETLLLRLLRGAGLSGLAAMSPKTDHVVRPLIETGRADILHYLKDRRIAFREDESNADPRYLRNRVRHELIPFLEERFQPQTRKLLAETAIMLGGDYALLEKHPSVFSAKRSSLGTEFSCSGILRLPEALLRRELRTLLRPLLAGKNPEKNLINELIKALKSRKNKAQTIVFKGLKFVRKGDTVRLLRF
jgi:tRNA(Ile)-lysidine synthase